MFRRTTKDAILPLQHALTGRDGQPITTIAVPKGTAVMTNYSAVNIDRRIWGEDAREWKPERWLEGAGGLPRTVGEAQMPGVYSNL